MTDTRYYTLSYPGVAKTLTLALCEACYLRRLETGASLVDKRITSFPQPCEDCEAKKGRIR